MYKERIYRQCAKDDDLISFQAMVKETDLYVKANQDLSLKTIDYIQEVRKEIEDYVVIDPEFKTSLKPYIVNGRAPQIAKEMSELSASLGVGPFASIAGAIAEYVGKKLFNYSDEVIVENGGDVYIKTLKDRIVGIYAGEYSAGNKIGVQIKAKEIPLILIFFESGSS